MGMVGVCAELGVQVDCCASAPGVEELCILLLPVSVGKRLEGVTTWVGKGNPTLGQWTCKVGLGVLEACTL